MSEKCYRCKDIHAAQKEGRTGKPCECGCHDRLEQFYLNRDCSTSDDCIKPPFDFTFSTGNIWK